MPASFTVSLNDVLTDDEGRASFERKLEEYAETHPALAAYRRWRGEEQEKREAIAHQYTSVSCTNAEKSSARSQYWDDVVLSPLPIGGGGQQLGLPGKPILVP